MKNWIWLLIITILMLFLHGCATTRSGGVEKRYDVNINVREGSFATFNMGVEADTSAETAAGDADATVDPRLSASVYGPSQIDGVMKDLSYIIEKWNKINAENTDNSDNSTNQNPPEPPDTGNGTSPDEPGDAGGNTGDDTGSDSGLVMADWYHYKTYPCDKTMNFGDDEEYPQGIQVEQQKCLFTDFSSCEQLPDSFLLVWQKGDQLEQLMVPNKCNMTWVTAGKDYRKFRPIDDKDPHPVGYAPRGFKAEKIHIMTKENLKPDTADCVLPWQGKDPDPNHDRRWWS